MLERRWARWILIFGVWTLLGALSAVRIALTYAYSGNTVSWRRALVIALADWYVWALLAPVIAWMDRVMERGQEKMQMHTYFEDYRAVDGVKLPFAIRRARPGFTWTYQFDEIKLNLPLDDSRFNKPPAP